MADIKYNICILYDSNSIHVSAIRQHLESFKLYSCNNILYVPGTNYVYDATNIQNIQSADVIIIHYSIRTCVKNHLFKLYGALIKKTKALKMLFIQDDYDFTNRTKKFIKKLGINIVFTVVPDKSIELIYPKQEFRNVKFYSTLTGYVSEELTELKNYKDMSLRENYICYRGRVLPYFYGNLGREKEQIGKQIKEICEQKNIPHDIEVEEGKRVYGDKWFELIQSSRTMLGTESGSNIFDFNGNLCRKITKVCRRKPDISYNEIYEKYLKDKELTNVMNQLSPKMFEAIALKTVLVLYEGEYSGILLPNIHYIPLKKDLSNIKDVISKINDIQYLNNIMNRAYLDIIASGKYSYQKFIKEFDEIIAENILIRISTEPKRSMMYKAKMKLTANCYITLNCIRRGVILLLKNK